MTRTYKWGFGASQEGRSGQVRRFTESELMTPNQILILNVFNVPLNDDVASTLNQNGVLHLMADDRRDAIALTCHNDVNSQRFSLTIKVANRWWRVFRLPPSGRTAMLPFKESLISTYGGVAVITHESLIKGLTALGTRYAFPVRDPSSASRTTKRIITPTKVRFHFRPVGTKIVTGFAVAVTGFDSILLTERHANGGTWVASIRASNALEQRYCPNLLDCVGQVFETKSVCEQYVMSPYTATRDKGTDAAPQPRAKFETGSG
ncbi:hypothetical protein L210DRAFT_3502007 [Boletus edulis BED1]|uniref:Uncharacterized protein n=1 Tax=Boletus edulis BED1 TaxID=1328754 RepID=A0AAD4C2N6_BOLED|nr:hypothetical protein L210DRAFT_3502007 [Boletus edulis BED1]